jgi:putative phosphoribosyl transferase
MRFDDRHDAGRQLAQRLVALKPKQPVVLAIPRGGVPVGFEIASALQAPLDLVLVRKLGAPYQEELAIGAIADGSAPELVTDPALIAALDVPRGYLEETTTAALAEIERRRRIYLKDRAPDDITGCTAIVVDDGVATGSTMLAALRGTRRRNPARIVLAVPVAARSFVRRVRNEVDLVVCLHAPVDLIAVGMFYRDFRQLHDQEVVDTLDQAHRFATADAGSEAPPGAAPSPGVER